jgi:signal peptidase II
MSRIAGRLSLMAYAVAVAVIGLDQLLKYWIVDVIRLPEGVSTPVTGFFRLSMVWNKGFSFGLLNIDAQWSRWALSVFSIAVAAILAVWVRRVERPVLALAIGFVMGGAIGNVIDRVRYGAVVDFLDFSQLHFPWVFNIADAAINVGVALLLLDTVLAPRKRAVG